MRPLYTAAQSKKLDQLSERFGVSTDTLMRNAGRQIADLLAEKINPTDAPIVFLVGKGNNGGDALIAADLLKKMGYKFFLVRPGETPVRGGWIVDGLLGVGLDRPVEGWFADTIKRVNGFQTNVLAIDIPSGLSSDTGKPLGCAIRATITASLGGLKLGTWTVPGCEYAGEILEIDIGIPKQAIQELHSEVKSFLLESSDFKNCLPPRKNDSHKKDYGHVLVIAGSKEMPGAGYLTSLAALRSGAGMVTYCMPQESYEKFDPTFSEVMVKPFSSAEAILEFAQDKEAIVLGPGMGESEATQKLIAELFQKLEKPMVVDADGINALAKQKDILTQTKAAVIFTPHPGEMGRLLGQSTKEIQENRIASVREAAAKWKQCFVLKGYRSLIGTYDGELYVNPTGNPGMATAGSGDVLAGVIAGLIAQGVKPKLAGLAGTFLHGLAGDLAANEMGEKGLISSDFVRYIPKALHEISL